MVGVVRPKLGIRGQNAYFHLDPLFAGETAGDGKVHPSLCLLTGKQQAPLSVAIFGSSSLLTTRH